MAGAGRKVFTAAKLTSSDVNGYLMDQVTMAFADVAARDAAIPSPDEGMRAYTGDDFRYWCYTDGAWDIESEPVQAWTPTITQGGGSISKTIHNGWYRRSRGWFDAILHMTLTGTGAGGNRILITTPFTVVDFTGTFGYYDESLNLNRHAFAEPNTTDDIAFGLDMGADDYGLAPSDEITSGDILRLEISGVYA